MYPSSSHPCKQLPNSPHTSHPPPKQPHQLLRRAASASAASAHLSRHARPDGDGVFSAAFSASPAGGHGRDAVACGVALEGRALIITGLLRFGSDARLIHGGGAAERVCMSKGGCVRQGAVLRLVHSYDGRVCSLWFFGGTFFGNEGGFGLLEACMRVGFAGWNFGREGCMPRDLAYVVLLIGAG